MKIFLIICAISFVGNVCLCVIDYIDNFGIETPGDLFEALFYKHPRNNRFISGAEAALIVEEEKYLKELSRRKKINKVT